MPWDKGVFIGTCGWSYPKGEGTWRGCFYPPGTKDELSFYSRCFNAVEINTSFYNPPDPECTRGWARRVPDGFVFTAKLWQKFTHPGMFEAATGADAAVSVRDVDVFKRGIEPLAGSGRLGALLAQFPPSFKNNAFSRRVIEAIARTFGEYNLAVELRDKSWSDDTETAKLLSSNYIAWVNIDEPKFPGSIAADLPLTSGTAYFRFHGRNAAEWWRGDSETRYRYLYSDTEICELAERVRRAGANARLMFAFFNNHPRAYAPRNAAGLAKALGLLAMQVPLFGFGESPDNKE